ncbi:hypothetical protein ABZ070_10060 [Streptomyces sp. NPDC006283]|uniref:hypothetical protein n=1 Tax=Streptomyces sp. NPDC006283 TaxID=3156741 RepID=UPI0033BDF39D
MRKRIPFHRILSDPLDSPIDEAKKIATAHQRHDASRKEQPPRMGRKGSPGNPSDNLSGPSSASASTPKKRRWL